MARAAAPPERGWRRKPQVRADGYETDGLGFGDRPTPRWVLEGPHAEEDLRRVMQGTICICCWQPFPEPLGKLSCARIMAEMAPFGRPDTECRRLISNGRCPICATEVSADMAQAYFKGVQERSAAQMEAATLRRGEHGDYEHLIDDSPSVYVPPGWSR